MQNLAAHLVQHHTTKKQSLQSVSASPTNVQQASEYIHAHLTEELSLGAIATTVGMSQ